jgi:DNA-binding transcriptional LysR family regulator
LVSGRGDAPTRSGLERLIGELWCEGRDVDWAAVQQAAPLRAAQVVPARSLVISAKTQAGERFRERARLALLELERASDAARRVGQGQEGRLVLRFTLMSTLTIIPRTLVRYQKAYPHVAIDLSPGGSIQQLEAIRAGTCDIGFMPLKRDVAPLATELIQRAPLTALRPQAHPLAKRKTLRLGELARERFVFLKLDNEPQTRALFRQRCLDAGFEPDVALEIEQLEVLLAMVAAVSACGARRIWCDRCASRVSPSFR